MQSYVRLGSPGSVQWPRNGIGSSLPRTSHLVRNKSLGQHCVLLSCTVPISHLHAVSAEAPLLLFMLAGHAPHVPVPAMSVYVSGGHATHRVEPGFGVCVPGGQSVHVVWSSKTRSLYVPGAHCSHVRPLTISPPGHCTLKVVICSVPS